MEHWAEAQTTESVWTTRTAGKTACRPHDRNLGEVACTGNRRTDGKSIRLAVEHMRESREENGRTSVVVWAQDGSDTCQQPPCPLRRRCGPTP